MKACDVKKGMVLDVYPIHKRICDFTIDNRDFLIRKAKFPIMITDVRMYTWSSSNSKDDCAAFERDETLKTMFFVDAAGNFGKLGVSWAIDMFVLAKLKKQRRRGPKLV